MVLSSGTMTSDPGLNLSAQGTTAPKVCVDNAAGPPAPLSLEETGIDADVLANLALKSAYTVPRFTTGWAADVLCLPGMLMAELLDGLCKEHLLEVLGQAGPFNHHFAITDRGCERARRLMEISGYVGPAPVSLQAYSQLLDRQFRGLPLPSPQDIAAALSDMILPEKSIEVAGLAMLSRRSLFMHGPPGNGKTSLGHMLHNAVRVELWIPHCIGVGESIIRVFDPECHERISSDSSQGEPRWTDRRWVRIKQPFIVVGGELTIAALDLIYSPTARVYEAPLHFKANGGMFLIDDFGCQRVPPEELLNRWIHPLEREVDFLTLQTGQQLEVPFRQMLIVSTNLDPDKVMSPAFLRRMGYRLHLDNPEPERYAKIFHRYAARCDCAVTPELLEKLAERYRAEQRPMRGCEPRDLIERCRDICRYRGRPFKLDEETLEVAWRGYFG